MKSLGVIRDLDNLGRYVLPREIIKAGKFVLGKSADKNTTRLELSVRDNMVYLKKYEENEEELVVSRNIDPLGRITLPREIIKRLAWKMRVPSKSEGTPLEVLTEGEYIILREYKPGCIFCNSITNNKIHRDKLICRKCISEISK